MSGEKRRIITDVETMLAAIDAGEIKLGDRVHVRVVGPGQVLDDAYWTTCISWNIFDGLIITVGERKINLPWSDIIELYPVDGPPSTMQHDILQ